jgi:hypothetical protein
MTSGSTVDLAAENLVRFTEISRCQTKSGRTVCHMIDRMHVLGAPDSTKLQLPLQYN